MADALQTLVDDLTFPEGPRWHDGRLWFSDFYSHRVLAVDASGKLDTIVDVPQQPSGLGWTRDGKLLIVSMLDRKLLRLDGTALTTVADLSSFAGGPCNDMVVDRQGRAYVGNFGFDRHKGEAQRTTCIVRVDPDGRLTKAADDLTFPNGTVITPDGKTMIVGETFAHRLTAFDVAADGTLSNPRLWARVEGCYPDGICLDAEGAIWVSDPFGHRLLRVFEGGHIAQEIPLAPRGAYACMLGGDDRRTLFVCTNSGSGPAMADKRDGRIETLRVDVPGAGWP
ncbi:SMP-30/gluconolactonase/LRE family protein [Reyranella sp. CPCC 100927]|uniref:SMP-30/gluconolactonase/LRE family protein n=1 Tax=Reyranella sp. CPCC 100927 TaxID=2599616 RepID=UPI0011B4B561|nr:SMP-30/gluconolactonase/LRE family protein [Reyranella sp. CPCC 100927]TWT15883.1 SMP-30/gluconolactonase/LRE family protein [Reyranella sp. CPCC 100927]